MMNKNSLIVTTPTDTEIVITRLFVAPRPIVWRCWTEPALVRRWLLGPPGWTFETCEIDLHVGGSYRYVWRSADGAPLGMRGTFTEVTPPSRLADRQIFDEDWTGGETVGTLVFEEVGATTKLTSTFLYSSKAARDGALATGMTEGMSTGYDRLDEILLSAVQSDSD